MNNSKIIRESLEAAKLYAIRYPNKGADKLIRLIDEARVAMIELSKTPREEAGEV